MKKLATLAVTTFVLLLPASALAGTAVVRNSTEGRGDDAVQYVEYTGAGTEANVVMARLAGTIATITDAAGAVPGAGCIRPNPTDATTVRCTVGNGVTTRPAANAFQLALGFGNDTGLIVGSPTTSGTIDGGPGNDLLDPGDGRGSNGDDAGLPTGALLRGGAGNDVINGGTGNDEIDEGAPQNGTDTINGGGGIDTVTYAGRSGKVTADLAGDRDDGEARELDQIVDVDNLIGGRAGDRLSGDNGANELTGGEGTDRLDGRGGPDYLRSADQFEFEAGGARTKDRLIGGGGDDSLVGTAGANRIEPGRGRDEVDAGAGNDRIFARDRSTDAIDCGRGRDRVSLDALDSIGRGCERVSRRGRARAVITGPPGLLGNLDDPIVTAGAECPWDFGRRCSVRFNLFRDRKLIATGAHRLPRVSDTEITVSARFNARGRAFLRTLAGGKPALVAAQTITRIAGGRSLTAASTETLVGFD